MKSDPRDPAPCCADDPAWHPCLARPHLDPASERQLCAVGTTQGGGHVLLTLDLEATSPEAAERGLALLRQLTAAAASDPTGWAAFHLRERHYAPLELGHV